VSYPEAQEPQLPLAEKLAAQVLQVGSEYAFKQWQKQPVKEFPLTRAVEPAVQFAMVHDW
jgi:hypothetical protein